jgi:TonB-linked SusC/RagA family outer membrane protein
MAMNAQQKTIFGKVTEASTGEAVIGASVSVTGTSTGTVTDIDGNFTLTVPENAKTLAVSYLGFSTQELPINKVHFDIALKEDVANLDEVVVIGYGTMKRKDLTGSVSSVSGSTLAAIPVATVGEALTGKMAGVQVVTTEGSPDAEVVIRVRGGGSVTGDNKPLYIVDGFPVNSISDIPSSDIESIDVLKDASSTAIYGSRGAAGVVIITTKSGKKGKPQVNYNFYYGSKKIANTLETLTPSDYVHWQYERALLKNSPDEYTKYLGNYQDIDLYGNIQGNDWLSQVFGRTGHSTNHNLSINGGDDKTQYLFSYNNLNDKGIMLGSDYKRNNLSMKVSTELFKSLEFDISARYSHTSINGSGMNEQDWVSTNDTRLKNAMIYPPIPVGGLTDTGETDDSFYLYDPLVSIRDNDRKQTRSNFNVNAGLSWEIISNLKLRTEVGFDDYRNTDNRFYGTTTYYVLNNTSDGLPVVRFIKELENKYRNTNTLNYNFKDILPKSHHLNWMVGEEYIFEKSEDMTSYAGSFPKDFSFYDTQRLAAIGSTISLENKFNPDDKLLSFFSRVNYDFADKYIFSATFRADGSSKFPKKENQWAYNPSAAVAWRISSESFMEDTQDWLSDLKLRFSYGTAGNNNVPKNYMSQEYSPSNTIWINDYKSYWAPSKTMANPDLKWETNVTRVLGLDITLLKGKLSAAIEGYVNNTKDLLIKFPTPGTGYDYQYRNMGENQNKGMEFTLNWVVLDKKNYGLNFSGNIGFNRNKLLSLNDAMTTFNGKSDWAGTEINDDYLVVVGQALGQIMGYKSAGRYEVSDFSGYDAAKGSWTLKEGVVDCTPVIGTLRPGSMKLQNISEGDNLVTEDYKDRVVIGNVNPLHTGGFAINGRLYGFDLTANFNWSYGNDIYNANKIEYTSTSKYHSRNMIDIMAEGNRWNNLLPDGTICNDPATLEEMNRTTTMWSPLMKKFVLTDWAIEDGSFLRLNTLTFGYTFPLSLTKQAMIQNLRLYVTGYNVFCWTKYSGFDPEVSTRRKDNLTPGVDYSAYPRSRQLVFGLNLTF